MRYARSGILLCVLAALLAVWFGSPAAAQSSDVTMTVAPEHVGLGGLTRPGTWTPMLVTLSNASSAPRRVRVQWEVQDIDGDVVQAQRSFSLSPQRSARAWLYAPLTVTVRNDTAHRLRLIDDESDELLLTTLVEPAQSGLMSAHERAVGVVGTNYMGLEPYGHEVTQQEATRFVRGLVPQTLPDRWHGYSVLQSLIWTPAGGDPTSADLSADAQRALREWVRRGGHLVIVLPTIGELWTSSPFADMLPKVDMLTLADQPLPVWLGVPLGVREVRTSLRVMQPKRGANVSVLLRDAQGLPLVVASPYGLGRVTLVGVDVSEPRMAAMALPNGDTLWRSIFGWRGPWFTKVYLESELKNGQISQPQARAFRQLEGFVPMKIAMTGTTATAMLLAIIVFGVYWFAAGPVGHAVLRGKKMVKHSWAAFTVVIVFFTLVTWAGAAALRPRTSNVMHFSVVDIDAASGLTHMRSWLSLFMPEHGQVDVAVTEGTAQAALSSPSTIASMGLLPDEQPRSFPNAQAYTLDGGAPNEVTLPIRATAKQLQTDRLAPTQQLSATAENQWPALVGRVAVASPGAWPSGKLVHSVPGDLRDVVIVYCPGNGDEPFIWRHGQWKAGEVLDLNEKPKGQVLAQPPPASGPGNRKWRGHLADLIDRKPGHESQDQGDQPQTVASDRVIQAIEMLAFYDSLPPPDFRQTQGFRSVSQFTRSLGRTLDITPRLPLRGLIIMGHLEESPLPTPLTVDGKTLPSTGWTVVRWTLPVE